jgi:PleD family two-component response regulator
VQEEEARSRKNEERHHHEEELGLEGESLQAPEEPSYGHDHQSRPARARAAIVSAPAPPSTLLVATSDSGTRALLRKALHVRAVEVVEASDGVEALALARRLELDLVLLDAFSAVLDCIRSARASAPLPSSASPHRHHGLEPERTVELAYPRGGRDTA